MYTIKDTSIKTGIGVHTLRAWEKRYNVVNPERGESGRRYYSSQDIEKLKMIALLKETGEKISHLAKFSHAELEEKINHLSEKDLYPHEQEKLQTSLYILKQAFDYKIDDILKHELQALDGEIQNENIRKNAFMNQLIIPFYSYILEKGKNSHHGSPWFKSVQTLVTENLKNICPFVQSDDFSEVERCGRFIEEQKQIELQTAS